MTKSRHFQEAPVVPASDIYAEAKNWAGELISGQTKAGKILVRRSNLLRGGFL